MTLGRGGPRYGAGRPGHRLMAEQLRRIDIRRWHRGGYLSTRTTFTWQWSRDGEKTGSIGVTPCGGAIRLAYNVKNDTQWRDASQTILTTTTPCHLGGSRPWFLCPICGDRAAVLYLRSSRFACRQCQRVSYTSQSGSALSRAIDRYHRIDALVMAGKPKWQRWATFDRLLDQHEAASYQADGLLAGQLRRLGLSTI